MLSLFFHLLIKMITVGSEEERIAVETACQYGTKAGIYCPSGTEDVTVEITMDEEGLQLGGDAKLSVTIKNTSSEQRSVTLFGQVAVVYYTGVHKATVKKDQVPVDLQPGEGERLYIFHNFTK